MKAWTKAEEQEFIAAYNTALASFITDADRYRDILLDVIRRNYEMEGSYVNPEHHAIDSFLHNMKNFYDHNREVENHVRTSQEIIDKKI